MEKNCPTDKEIKEAAALFRKEQCEKSYHNNQYLLVRENDVFIKNIQYQDLTQLGNTATLYNNMRLLGLTDEIWVNEYLKYGFRKKRSETAKYIRSQTHHIIPKNLIGDSRIHFDLKSIIDDGRNGIILPTTTNCELNFASGTAHGKHSNDYEEYIVSQIRNCDTDNLWTTLDDIKEKLYKGELHLNNKKICNFITY